MGGGAGRVYALLSVSPSSSIVAASARNRALLNVHFGMTAGICQNTATGGLCLAQVDDIVLTAGSFEQVKHILDTHAGLRPSLMYRANFVPLFEYAAEGGSIRGISEGSRLSAWLKDAVRGQSTAGGLDWTTLVPGVSAFSYLTEVKDRIRLILHLQCESESAAAALRKMLSAALGAARMVQDPGARIEDVDVHGSGRSVDLSLEAPMPKTE